jgi:alpha-galactosidase
MLQYANPMAGNCLALGKASNVSFVGLCHGVQTTMEQIAQFIDVPKDEIVFTCGGINHMDWFLTLTRNGEDLYPRLAEAMEKPAIYKSEKVRGEVFRHFGYFMTETTGHLAEYVPWFRKSKAARDMYCDEPGFGGQSGAYFSWCDTVAKRYEGKNQLDGESTRLEARSVEYCSYIIEAVTTGVPFKFMGNVRNDGYITNLPSDCCVEVPTFADQTGLHPMRIGKLPIQCAALCMTNVNVQLLAAEAGINGDTEALMQAIAMDPLTAAVCTLKEIREMTAEMLEAERRWLPQFKGKKVAPKPAVHIPANIKAIDLAQDPAQAILKRFMDLAVEKKQPGGSRGMGLHARRSDRS